MTSTFSLLTLRRFAPMFLCTCLGAFNDNYFKNALTILITFQLAQQSHSNAATIISIATALFILPFFLFSGIAGGLADRYSKQRLVLLLKITELILFIFAAIALISAHITGLLVVLALIGIQAAFFGPVKYAILPTLLKEDELIAGNGLTEAGTFLTILLGTMLGGLLILQPHGAWMVGGSMIAMGVVGVIASRFIPMSDSSNPDVVVSLNPITTTFAMIRHAKSFPPIWFAILGISWFWAVGATYLTQLPVFTKEVIGGNEQIVTLFMATFSVGVGIGSIACQRIMRGVIHLRYTPWMLLGIALCGLDVWLATANVSHSGTELIGLSDYLSSWRDWRLVIDLALLSIFSGIFIVPLYTLLQTGGQPSMCARAVASNNVINALFITVSSLAAAGAYAFGFSVRDVFLATALLGLPVAYIAHKKIRSFA